MKSFRKQLGPSEIKSGDRMRWTQKNDWSGRASLRRFWEEARHVKTWGKKYILEEEKGNAKALKSQRKLLILMTRKSGPCAFSKVSRADSDWRWGWWAGQEMWGRFVRVLSHSVTSDSSAAPWTVAHQAPLSVGFPRQEWCSGLRFPPPGDLHDLRTEPVSSASPALASRFFTILPPKV